MKFNTINKISNKNIAYLNSINTFEKTVLNKLNTNFNTVMFMKMIPQYNDNVSFWLAYSRFHQNLIFEFNF